MERNRERPEVAGHLPHREAVDQRSFGGRFSSAVLGELIKLIVQVFDDVPRFNRRKFPIRHMRATFQLLSQRIQRPNDSLLAGIDAGVVAAPAISVMQALPIRAVAWQCGVDVRREQHH
jgi:hypothetical protein